MSRNMHITGPIFKITVKPNAKENSILGFDSSRNAYTVSIKARPEDNKANTGIVKFPSKILKKRVSIISGLRSREKLIKISG